MRGTDSSQLSLFITCTVEDFVPSKHPLRAMRKLVDEALKELNDLFNSIYSDIGRESIAPERLIRASLLQILFTLRSERQLMEHLRYNMLYRWFVGLEMDDAVWHHSTFSKNRERLLENKVFIRFFETVIEMAHKRKLISNEHFSVDGSLIDAWASHKSFRPNEKVDDDDNDDNFHGQTRRNDTHTSTTDADAELMRKSTGKEAKLSYGIHHIMENRSGLVVAVSVTPSASVNEREAAIELLTDFTDGNRKTLGADKGYDTQRFVDTCRELKITPHVAQNINRRGGSSIDQRTTRHEGYEISMTKRKLIETTFGWAKQYGGLRRILLRGIERVADRVILTMATFNLLRMRNIVEYGGSA